MSLRPSDFRPRLSCPPLFTSPGPPAEQLLGYLDGIERRALEELVAGDPKAQAVVHRAVFANPAHGAIVLFRLVEREGIFAFGRVVDDLQAGRLPEHGQRRFDRRRLLELGAHRNGMAR